MTDLVTVTRAEYNALLRDAECWRALWRSEHVRDLLAEWAEWRRRRDLSEATAGMAALVNWRAIGPTYAELARRRTEYDCPALTPEQITSRARASWAAVEQGRAVA